MPSRERSPGSAQLRTRAAGVPEPLLCAAENEDPEDPGNDEKQRQFALKGDRRHQRDAGDDPRQRFPLQRLEPEVPARFEDERNDDRADAIKQTANPDGVREVHVDHRDGDDDQERRQRKRNADGSSAADAVFHVAAIDAELIRERSRTRRRDGETAIVFFFGEPRVAFDEIRAHVIRECNRAAESGRPPTLRNSRRAARTSGFDLQCVPFRRSALEDHVAQAVLESVRDRIRRPDGVEMHVVERRDVAEHVLVQRRSEKAVRLEGFLNGSYLGSGEYEVARRCDPSGVGRLKIHRCATPILGGIVVP